MHSKKLGLCFGFAQRLESWEHIFWNSKRRQFQNISFYVLHPFISYNPGWNESKLISPKMQVNFFPNQNYLSKKRKRNLKSKKTDTKKLFHDSWIHSCRQELSMQQVTNIQQRQNSDILEKIPFGLVRENTSGVTLFTLLFWGREGDPGIPKLLTTSK